MKLNIRSSKGFSFNNLGLIAKILFIFIAIILLVPLIIYYYPIAKYIIMVIIAFFIFEIVARALGNNILTYVVTGVLLYFIIYKYFYLSTSVFLLYLLLSVGFTSVVIWGTTNLWKEKK